jgi:predicted nuclease of predicted toxin-antitoxin system
MRFHLDEHVDHAIAHGLRQRGIEVTTTIEANLLGAPDELHLDMARRENRVIFTNDSDFLRLAEASNEHAGIAYCARGSRSIGYIVRHLCLMHDCLDDDEMQGRVEYV